MHYNVYIILTHTIIGTYDSIAETVIGKTYFSFTGFAAIQFPSS